jgi:hypothetical protein
MESWIAGIVIAVALLLVWWVFKPSRKPRSATDERAGSGMRLAERSLDAVARGLKVAVDDERLVERFDFPPFGRGSNRAATEVVTGAVDGEDVVAYRYSFALEGESKRREFDVTVLEAHFQWTGRLRVTSVPRSSKNSVEFADAWRIDEEPPGLDLLAPSVREVLLNDRFRASAIAVLPDAVVHIESGTSRPLNLDRDVALLQEIRSAIAAV